MLRYLIFIVSFVLIGNSHHEIQGHMIFDCPEPRSIIANKKGPCGADKFGQKSVLTIAPGPLTIILKETVVHDGAPARVSLSLDGSDTGFENCVLLNHIPHNDNQKTDGLYMITVDIPDVKCDKCTLQVLQVMTDKISVQTCPYDPNDTQPPSNSGKCFSNYHSCADLKITGKNARNSFTCPPQPTEWPFKNLPALTFSQNEKATWEGNFLVDGNVPQKFRTVAGSCSSQALQSSGIISFAFLTIPSILAVMITVLLLLL